VRCVFAEDRAGRGRAGRNTQGHPTKRFLRKLQRLKLKASHKNKTSKSNNRRQDFPTTNKITKRQDSHEKAEKILGEIGGAHRLPGPIQP
jgi:hypothetical protein